MQKDILKNHFIVVGPGRSGSTWIYEVFRSDNRICLAKNIKEVQFFNENFHKGINHYLKFFDNKSELTGEVSNLYFHDESVPIRIKSSLSNVKIIILIRDPLERLESIYNFKLREGSISKSSRKVFTEDELFTYIRIDRPVQAYLDTFGIANVHFVNFNHLNTKNEIIEIKSLYHFLGLPLINQKLPKKINESIIPRARIIGLIFKKIAIVLRNLGLYWVLSTLKRSDILKAIFFQKKKKTLKLSSNDKKYVRKELTHVKTSIQNLTKIDTSNWKNL